MSTILKSELSLHQVSNEFKQNFKETSWRDLSDFQAFALRKIGDALRQRNSQFFWSNGCYCWYTDDKQDHEQCVWMATNGSAMFEDITEGDLYRIEFC